MNQMAKKAGFPLLITVIAFAISFFSLCAIPLIQNANDTGQSPLQYLIAAVFWLFLLLGILSIFLTKHVHRTIRRKAKKRGLLPARRLPGIITFSMKPISIALYAVVFIGIVMIVTDILFQWASQYLMFPTVSCTLFAFALHCVVDGENYHVYTLVKKGIDK